MSASTAGDSPGSAPALPWPSPLPWQKEILTALVRDRSHFPHALLIHGRPGIGKHALALGIAQALLCEAPQDAALACGRCAACRYVVAGQHPDLLRIELMTLDEESGEPVMTETLSIDRIRALIDFVQLTSHRQRAKVVVIAPAERMNANAANALLKTLEEPPPGTYMMLVADQPGRLPATILSRCRHLAAPFPSPATARDWLATQGVVSPELVLAQTGGAPINALRLAVPALQTERKAWLTALAAPVTLPVLQLAARIEAAGREERKTRLLLCIDWMLGWTFDLARVVAGATPERNPDFAQPLRTLSRQVAPLALFRYHRALLGQRGELAHPLQPRLVAEALLFDYQALFHFSNAYR